MALSERPPKTKPGARYEGTYIFMKSYVCPVCESKLSIPTVMTGKARMEKQDWDLRPVFTDIDTIKYDVIHCNNCGYAVLKRYFGVLAKPHKELLRKHIAENYKPIPEAMRIYTYDEALMRFKIALLNAEVRQAHDSEKALISLKIAWLCRGAKEEMGDPETFNRPVRIKYDKYDEMEEKYLKRAMELFMVARRSETPPIAGMNEIALDFLLASLCGHFGNTGDATRLVSGILQSKQSTNSQKNRAREMLERFKKQ